MKEKPFPNLRGKWAQGIVPRNFCWVLKDRMAVCERLGGYGSGHRPVRRQEEIIWVLNNNFSYVVSVIPASHNLRNYEELGLAYLHRPLAKSDDFEARLPEIYRDLAQRLDRRERLLFHREEVGDVMSGFVGGYLVWAGYMPEPHRAVVVVEQLLGRKMGPVAREMVNAAAQIIPKTKTL